MWVCVCERDVSICSLHAHISISCMITLSALHLGVRTSLATHEDARSGLSRPCVLVCMHAQESCLL